MSRMRSTLPFPFVFLDEQIEFHIKDQQNNREEFTKTIDLCSSQLQALNEAVRRTNEETKNKSYMNMTNNHEKIHTK